MLQNLNAKWSIWDNSLCIILTVTCFSQYSVLLSYNPRHCTKMSLYPSVSRSNQSQVSGNLGYIPDGLLTQQPRVVSPLVLGQIQTTVNHSLERALEETGGMAAVLFLVAKVSSTHSSLNIHGKI